MVLKMSNEQKQKASSWMNLAYRTFLTIGMAILLRSVPVFIYDLAIWKKDVDDRTLSTVEMRIDLERHMEIWTTTTPREAFDRLKATEAAIITLKKADSLAEIDREQMKLLLAKIEFNTRK